MSRLTGLLLALALGLPAAARADHLGWVPWGWDLEQGLRQAREKRVPLMLVFSADT